MTAIYLIRHGENDWIGKRLPGRTPGLHLNDRGRAQARAIAELLRGVRLEAVYSSPLERALETAEPLAKVKGLRVRRRPGLVEMKAGSWQGQSLHNLRRRRLWPLIQFTPSLARFPGGESFVEAQARIAAELEALRRLHPRRGAAIACFTHADIIKLAVAHVLGLPLDLFQRILIQPASITLVQLAPGRAFLIRLNDARAGEVSDAG